jgi:hypothetical protein
MNKWKTGVATERSDLSEAKRKPAGVLHGLTLADIID